MKIAVKKMTALLLTLMLVANLLPSAAFAVTSDVVAFGNNGTFGTETGDGPADEAGTGGEPDDGGASQDPGSAGGTGGTSGDDIAPVQDGDPSPSPEAPQAPDAPEATEAPEGFAGISGAAGGLGGGAGGEEGDTPATLTLTATPSSVERADDAEASQVTLSCTYGDEALSSDVVTYGVSIDGDDELKDALGGLGVVGGVLTIPSITTLKGDAKATITVVAQYGEDTAQVEVPVSITHDNKSPVITIDGDAALTFKQYYNETKSVSFSVSDEEDDASVLNVECSEYDDELISAAISDDALVITPKAGMSGNTSVTLTVTDSKGATGTASVLVSVTENGAPEIQETTYTASVDEDKTLTINNLSDVLRVSDPDGDSISFSVSGGVGEQGSATISGDTLTYIPEYPMYRRNKTVVTFDVIADDGHDKTASCAFTVTINSVNDAPISNGSKSFDADEDGLRTGSFAGIAMDYDLDDTLRYSLIGETTAQGGTLDIDGASFGYQSALDFNGTDSFVVTVSDGNGGSCTVEYSVTVAPVNDDPFVRDGVPASLADKTVDENHTEGVANSYVLNLGTEVFDDVDLYDDPIHDALEFEAIPINTYGGEFELVGGILSFTPAVGYNDSWADDSGPVRFTLIARDVEGKQVEQEIEIHVNPVNSPLMLEDDDIGAVEKRVAKEFRAEDLLSNDSCYDWLDDPALPRVIARLDEKSENGGAISYDSSTGVISYISAPKYDGEDSFKYYVVGSDGVEVSATVKVLVDPKNYAPDIIIDSIEPFEMYEDDTQNPIVIEFHVDDDSTPPESVQVLRLQNPSSSILKSIDLEAVAGKPGYYTLTIQPKQDAHGDDEVTIQASDTFLVATEKLKVTILPVNDAPVAKGFSQTAVEDAGEIKITLVSASHYSDVDKDPNVTFNFDVNAVLEAHGDVLTKCEYDAGTGVITICFVEDFNTVDFGYGSFQMPFSVNDNSDIKPTNLKSAEAYITVNVTPVNDAPVIDSFDPTELTFDEDGSDTATIRFHDVETVNGQLILSASSNHPEVINSGCINFDRTAEPAEITVSALKDANWDPAEHPDDPILITFTVSDGYLTDTRTLAVYVTSINDVPEANDDHYATEDGNAIEIFPLNNDYDADKDDVVHIELLNAPALGTLDEIHGADGQLIGYTYTPFSGVGGVETLRYKAVDMAGESSEATITIDITRREPWPNISQVDPMIVEMSRGNDQTATETIYLNGIPRGASYELTVTLTPAENAEAFNGIALGGESHARTITISGVNTGDGATVEVPLGVLLAHNWVGKALVDLELSCTYPGDDKSDVTKTDDTSFRIVVWAENTPPHADDIYLEMYMVNDNGKPASDSASIHDQNPNNPGNPYVYDEENPVSLTLQGLSAPEGGFKYGWADANVDSGTITYHAFDTLPGTEELTETFYYNIVDKGGKEADEGTATAKGKVIVTIKHEDRRPVAVGDMFRLSDHWTPGESYTFDSLLSNDYDLDYDSEIGVHNPIPGENIKITKVTDASGNEIEGATINADGTISIPIDSPINIDTIKVFYYTIETLDELSGEWVACKNPGKIYVGFFYDPQGTGGGGGLVPASKPIAQDYEFTIDEDAFNGGWHTVDLSSLIMAWPNNGFLSSADIVGGDGVLDIQLPPEASKAWSEEEAITGTNYYLNIMTKPDQYGDVVIKYTVRTGFDMRPTRNKTSDVATLTIHVRSVNDRPVFDQADHRPLEANMANAETKFYPYTFSTNPESVGRGQVARFSVSAWDVEGDSLRVSAKSLNDAVVDSLTISVDRDASGWVISMPTALRRVETNSDNFADILVSVTDGALTSYGQFRVTFLPQPAPDLLETPAQDIAEDTSARFVAIKNGEDGNNPNYDKLKLVIERITLGDQTLAEGAGEKVFVLNGIGTLSIPDGKTVSFIPAKNYFQLDGDPYITIHYHLEDEIDLDRPHSASGTMQVRVFAQNDKVEIRNFNQQFITIEEDAAQKLMIEYDVKDFDRGYERTPEGTTVQRLVQMGVTHAETDGDGPRFSDIAQSSSDPDGSDSYHVTLIFDQIENAFHPNIDWVTNVKITADHCGLNSGFSDARDFRVYVSPVNDAPFYAVDPAILSGDLELRGECDEDTLGYTIDLRSYFGDLDDAQARLNITALSPIAPGGHGSIKNNGNGTVTYVPDLNFCTYDEEDERYAWFSFTISDPNNGTYSGKIKIYVKPINDAPVASTYGITMAEDSPSKQIDNPLKHVSDVDFFEDFIYTGEKDSGAKAYTNSVVEVKKGSIDLSIVKPEMGTIVFNDVTGGYTFTPAKDYFGSISIPYTVVDSHGVEASANITITVTAVNDMPRMAFWTGTEWKECDDIPGGTVSTGVVLVRDEHSTAADARGADAPNTPWEVEFKLWDVDSDRPINSLNIAGDLIPNNTSGYSVGGTHGVNGKYTLKLYPNASKNGSITLSFKAWDDTGDAKATTYNVALSTLPFNTKPWFTAPAMTDEKVLPVATHILSEDTQPTSLTAALAAADRETKTGLRYALVNDGEEVDSIITDLGVLTMGADGRYSFARTGEYAHRFGTLDFTARVYDDGDLVGSHPGVDKVQPKYADCVIRIVVNPENDAPSAPADLAVELNPYNSQRWFKQGDDVKLSWTASADQPSGANVETPQNALKYEVSYRVNNAWKVVQSAAVMTASADGKLSYSFKAPADNAADFAVRVRALDDGEQGKGVYGQDGYAKGAALYSGYATSDSMKLDNTLPTGAGSSAPSTGYTNKANPTVVITYALSDTGTGATGVNHAIQPPSIADVTGGRGSALEELSLTRVGSTNNYTVNVTNNGTYRLTFYDDVGNLNTRDVTVTNIDKLLPNAAAFGPDGAKQKAKSALSVTLTATDDAKTSADAMSGVASIHYIVSDVAELNPQAGDAGWTLSGASVDLSKLEKGTYYIYAKVTDVAGNVTINRSKPFELTNNAPVIEAQSVSMNEDSGERVFTVKVTDIDAADQATMGLEIGKHTVDAAVFGDAGFACAQTTQNTLTFTVKPLADAFLDKPMVIEVSLDDGSGEEDATATASFTLDVVPANDAPLPPADGDGRPTMANTTVTTADKMFKLNDQVKVSWTKPEDGDFHWTTETTDANLVYEVQYTVNGTWLPATPYKSTANASSLSFSAPPGNSDTFRVRVRTVDDGSYGKGRADGVAGGPLTSDWVESANSKLDNTAPTQSTTPATFAAWYNDASAREGVSFAYAASESTVGHTGVGSVKLTANPGNLTLVDIANPDTFDARSDQSFTGVTHGKYTFEATDRVGNKSTKSVQINLDRVAPKAASIAVPNELYARQSSSTIKLTANDDADASTSTGDGKSGYSKTEYMITTAGGQTVQDWTNANIAAMGGIADVDVGSGNDKGDYVLYVRTTDVAGNVTVADAVNFKLINNPPRFTGSNNDTIVEDYGNGVFVAQIPVEDIDGDKLELTTTWTAAGSAISSFAIGEHTAGTEQIGITFNLVDDAFDEAGIVIPLTLADGDSTRESSYTLVINPANDAPVVPGSPTMTNARTTQAGVQEMFKLNDDVLVSWTNPNPGDEHWVTETPDANLVYEVQYTVDGASWLPATPYRSEANASSLSFKAPSGNSGTFRVRVRTVDDGRLYEADAPRAARAESDWVMSANSRLDNTAPVNDPANADTTWYNMTSYPDGGVPLQFAAVDNDASGATGSHTGIDTVSVTTNPNAGLSANGVTTDPDGTFDAAFAGDYLVGRHGNYVFTMTDRVGNASTKPVQVNIDRVAPIAPAIELLTTETLYAYGTAMVRITAADDQAATTYDGKSGLARTEYQITDSVGAPTGAWTQVGTTSATASVDVNLAAGRARGTYYVHARTVDVAGNVTNADSFEVTLNNNQPQITAANQSMNEGGALTFSVSVSDSDAEDRANLTLDASWNDAENVFEGAGLVGPVNETITATGKTWTFTATPVENAFMSAPMAIALTANDASDTASAENTATIELIVNPVNDAPEAPADPELDELMYRGGGDVLASWAKPVNGDLYWKTETPDLDLVYQVRTSIDQNGASWSDAITTAADAGELGLTAPADTNTDYYHFSVNTLDDGSLGNNAKDATGLPSGAVISGFARIDSTAPVLGDDMVADWHNAASNPTGVSFTFTANDSPTVAGHTGIGSVAITQNPGNLALGAITDANSYDASFEQTFEDATNGVYRFSVADRVGNVSSHEVTVNLDRVAPNAADVALLTSGPLYALGGVMVQITATDDADATGTDGQSGFAGLVYQITNSAATPADGEWTPVGTDVGDSATVNLGATRAKGTYYVHTRATDVAGNVTDDSYPVTLVNNPPQFVNMPAAIETIDEDDPDGYRFTVTASDVDGIANENVQPSVTWDDMSVVPATGVSFTKLAGSDDTFELTITPAADAFKREGVAFTLTLTDADGGATDYKFALEVIPVNDEPESSVIDSAANTTVTDVTDMFKGGDIVHVDFSEADDLHWTQETLMNALTYELQYSLDGASWTTVHDAVFDGTDFDFAAPRDLNGNIINTDDFSLQVIVHDDGSMNNGIDPSDALSVISDAFGPMQLDNQIPLVNSTIAPTADIWTNTSVAINLSATDDGVGQTGVRDMTSANSAVTGANGSYQAVVTDNGTYSFTARDMVLNSTSHDVEVTNIDKLLPQDTVFAPNGITQQAYQPLSASLTYADALPTLTDGQSGIRVQRYLITTDTSAEHPDAGSAGWSAYDAAIDMSALDKGTYYIWAEATDNAGNVGYTRSNPFVLTNNAPVIGEIANQSRAEDSAAWTVDVTLEDIDPADAGNLILSASWSDMGVVEAGDIGCTLLSGTTWQLAFTPQADRFLDGPISITLTGDDGAGDENSVVTSQFTLDITPVNDAPDPVAISSVTNESYAATDLFKAGDTVLVRFGESDDFHWAQETLIPDISYELEYSLDGVTWMGVTEAPYDADGFSFTAPDGTDTDTFYVRVRAIDDGNTSGGTRYDDELGILASDWTQYGPMQIDVTDPTADIDYTPKDWTNGDVTLILTTGDAEPLSNDRTVVDIVSCEDVTIGRAAADREACDVVTIADDLYNVIVTKNGTYAFTVVDSVGHTITRSQTIDNIDKLLPATGAQPANNTSVQNGSGGILAQLNMFDADASDFFGKSELAGSWYFIDNNPADPASASGNWISVPAPFDSAQQRLDDRGTYYAHTKAVDTTGNETIQTFGPFSILNNPPVVVAPDALYTVQNRSVSGTGSASDSDGDSLTIRVSSSNESVIPSGNVQCSITGDVLNVNVTPAANAYNVGGVPVTITVDDGNGGTASATFSVYVYHINGAPTASVSGSGATTERGKALAGRITVSASDGADGEFANSSFNYSIDAADQGRNGRFSVDAQGNVNYTPNGNYVGDDSAMVSVSESQNFSGNVNPDAIPAGAFVAGADRLGVKVRVSVSITEPEATPTPRPTSTPTPSATPSATATGTPRPTWPVVTPNPNPTTDPLTQYDPNATPDPNALSEVSFGDPNDPNGGTVPIHRLRAFNFVNGVNLEELGIPLGALPCFASTEGYDLEQIDKLLSDINEGDLTQLYSYEYLAKIFDMPYQMVKPIDFDELDWEQLPERGYELPIIARQESVVAHAWFRPVLNEDLEEGYMFEIEFEPGVLGDPNYAGIHFSTQLRDIMMSETQYMDPELFEREDEWRMNQFIPKEFMTGKQFIYVAVPVVYDPEGHQVFEPTEEQLKDWHDRTEELQLPAPHIPPYDPEQEGPRLAYDPEHHGWYSETQQEAPEEEDDFGRGFAGVEDDDMTFDDDEMDIDDEMSYEDDDEMIIDDDEQIGAPR